MLENISARSKVFLNMPAFYLEKKPTFLKTLATAYTHDGCLEMQERFYKDAVEGRNNGCS